MYALPKSQQIIMIMRLHRGCPSLQVVAGDHKRLRCPFLAKNPLSRAPRKCTMGCDPTAHIFSCALCSLKVIFTTFLF